MKVKVHCNIRTRMLSITALDGAFKGRVIGSAERILLKDVQFKVSDAGRERVRRTRVKNVHAGAVGELVGVWGAVVRGDLDNKSLFNLGTGSFASWEGGKAVTYNPYKNEGFVLKQRGTRVLAGAAQVLLDKCSLEASELVYAS